MRWNQSCWVPVSPLHQGLIPTSTVHRARPSRGFINCNCYVCLLIYALTQFLLQERKFLFLTALLSYLHSLGQFSSSHIALAVFLISYMRCPSEQYCYLNFCGTTARKLVTFLRLDKHCTETFTLLCASPSKQDVDKGVSLAASEEHSHQEWSLSGQAQTRSWRGASWGESISNI